MRSLKIKLKHCYGIQKLDHTFDFNKSNTVAIYAPNGVMKSSLAKTFQDIQENRNSSDRIFEQRLSDRLIVDETGAEPDPNSILIVRPYDEEFGGSDSEKISTLLVNATLRKEYENLIKDVENAKESLLESLKEQSGSKRDLEAEISSTFTSTTDDFLVAISRIAGEVEEQRDAPFANIPYDLIFDPKVVEMFEQDQVRENLEDYVQRFNELLDKSTYFKRGTFTYYNASNIAKTLANNGFFDASHSINLNAEEKLEINSEKQLIELITKERDEITSDKELRGTFRKIETLLHKNANVRKFNDYITEHQDILPNMSNLGKFKDLVWKSYLVEHKNVFNDLVSEMRKAANRKREIEQKAQSEQTEWRTVIEMFNERFFVPFELEMQNQVRMVLNQEKIPRLLFTFKEGEQRRDVKKDALMEVLSTGEKRSFYLLNVLFEIRARQQTGQKTLLIVDDIADSFDYKNKFAIIQYLKDISDQEDFRQILLTHNFDFFRTVQSRFVSYDYCFMATKTRDEIEIMKAIGIKNIFVNDWKRCFGTHARKRIACIPFMRNLVEFTKGTSNSEYKTLSSLLHVRESTDSITDVELFDIFTSIFGRGPISGNPTDHTVLDLIYQEADNCVEAATGANFENKIVLSIAARLRAEQYLLRRCASFQFKEQFSGNQTTVLLKRFRNTFPQDLHLHPIHVIEQVVLMTPENIHLNSFMYEPILDMSDDHLRKIYREVKAL